MTTAAISFNPMSYRTPFLFTDRDEWLDALCEAIQKANPSAESAINMRRLSKEPFDLAKADFYRFKAYAETGTNEGHYVYLEATHRLNRTSVTLVSCKTFDGLEAAIGIAAALTRMVYTP